MREGLLAWTSASGVGTAWATASGASGNLFGFVRSFTYTSAQTVTTVMERGRPNHHKVTTYSPINVTLNLAWTGTVPQPVSGSGASVPMFLLEYRAVAPENGGSGRFFQFYGAVSNADAFTEAETENTYQYTIVCLGMSGANASGYLLAPTGAAG